MKSQGISSQLADRLAGIILNDDAYKPGEKLPTERELAEQLKVSRTSVREAAKQLEARGLVEIRRGVGTFVANNPGVISDPLGLDADAHGESSLAVLEDWYSVRMIIESEAMELVAKNASSEELAHLAALLDRELELASTAGEDFMNADQSFHCALAQATHNIIMTRLIPSLHASIYYDMVRALYPQLRAKYNRNASENHRNIIKHLNMRDGKGANLAMRYHMAQAIADLHSLKP